MTTAFKYRTFWPRFWAGWIDLAVLWPLFYFGDRWVWNAVSHPIPRVLWFTLASVAPTAYSIICHGHWGQTIGKRLLGVRVLDVSERKLSVNQTILRDLLSVVLITVSLTIDIPTVAMGQNPYDKAKIDAEGLSVMSALFGYVFLGWVVAEFVTMLFNDKRRALHDFIAGSVVIRSSRARPRLLDRPAMLSGEARRYTIHVKRVCKHQSATTWSIRDADDKH